MNNNYYLVKDGDRYFLVPLLLGGLGGAAIASLSGPRPVFVNPPMQVVQPQPMPYPPAPMPYPPYRPYPMQSGFGYSSFNYNY